ncbi:hypothetical protein ASPZODRAFT_2016530 [Penicilliopsis zonata CBS 506.65]|uniref:Uncharacterized protein n=1 Tax=Penicilliopsis zonata CBS 506.65 TaxID=1073090 RepID=A0A1L9SHR2_9EURO|nr:hypothetical protein ASPZODRAFT_2016530 [Penicilliopsis zonata CBS 506.65]OJJ46749.1 hypothetical protein ASPZODRAFT_2016530 [Penicilliopsis zonata CBS 506.65]
MPQPTSFSQASRATSRPQTRPGVAAAPDAEADTLAAVRRRTYSAYAAGKDNASGVNDEAVVLWLVLLCGSYRADNRVAASKRARGREEFEVPLVVEIEKGSGAGSGQERVCSVKDLGVGISSSILPSSSFPFLLDALWCSSERGIKALVKNSLTDLVWWKIRCRWDWKLASLHRP